jgi:CheY-like chemotaxis protein
MTQPPEEKPKLSPQEVAEVRKSWRSHIHKLNNSLAAILGHSTLVSHHASADQEIQEQILRVREATKEALVSVDILGQVESIVYPLLIHMDQDVGLATKQFLQGAGDLPTSRLANKTPSASDLEQYGGIETILLVEDDGLLRSALQDCLSQLGYQLIISKDGKEAFELIDKHQDEIDLLCVDYHLPRFNGIEITEKLRSVRAKCRAILMSGSPIQYEDEEIGGVHFSHILTKPVELSEFARVIRKTLDSPSTERVE